MIFSSYLALSTLVFSITEAFSFPGISLPDSTLFTRAIPSSPFAKRAGDCPPVWGDVASELSQLFFDTTTSECNDDARAAIRAMFHDCGTWSIDQGETGGCDGSLILGLEAFTRDENRGLEDISTKLQDIATKFQVGVADLIVFAASVAVVTCPLGPVVNTFVGRTDSSNPAPPNKLPDMHASGDSLFELFQQKNINAAELAALLGAHATSKSFHQTPTGQGDIGLPQDSTPGIWDVAYYSETTNPPEGVFVFESDLNLAQHPVVGPEFSKFVNRQLRWNAAFVLALTKMSLFGVPGGAANLTDCTDFIPTGTRKRDIRAAPINGRVR